MATAQEIGQTMKRLLTILLFAIGALVATLMSPTTVESYEGEGVRLPENPTYWEYAFFHVSEKWGIGHAEAFYKIIESESGWCHTRWNGQYGDCPTVARTEKIPGNSNAQGLCQTMLSVHGLLDDYEFMNDGYRQIDWCIEYAEKEYGNPIKAWEEWKRKKHW